MTTEPYEAEFTETKKSFFRSTLFQIFTIGIVSFIAPGLWNATNSLGAGGALLPYLVYANAFSGLNAANSIIFGFMGLGCISAPLLVNKIGVKWTLILGTFGWAPYSASLYQNNRYGTTWFVLFASVLCGISAGLYWAAEGAIVLSYPEHRKRGRYLAIWLMFKNSGQIIGGAINLGTNIHRSTGGKVNYDTLLAFVALQCLGLPFALLISNPQKVQREDGTKVVIDTKTSTTVQLRALWRTVSTRKVGVLLPIFFSSWFYWGYASSFLTLYFSVRARALASFLSAITGVIATSALGFYLDSQKFSLQTRARTSGIFVMTLFSGMLIWALVIQHEYLHHPPGKLDWTSKGFGRGFGLYIMINTAGNLVQNYLYWSMGSLGDGTSELTRYAGLLRGVESLGQCASFGINSSKFNLVYTVVINIVFWAVSVPFAWLSLSRIGEDGSVHNVVDEAKVDTQTPSSRASTPGREKNEELA